MATHLTTFYFILNYRQVIKRKMRIYNALLWIWRKVSSGSLFSRTSFIEDLTAQIKIWWQTICIWCWELEVPAILQWPWPRSSPSLGSSHRSASSACRACCLCLGCCTGPQAGPWGFVIGLCSMNMVEKDIMSDGQCAAKSWEQQMIGDRYLLDCNFLLPDQPEQHSIDQIESFDG